MEKWTASCLETAITIKGAQRCITALVIQAEFMLFVHRPTFLRFATITRSSRIFEFSDFVLALLGFLWLAVFVRDGIFFTTLGWTRQVN